MSYSSLTVGQLKQLATTKAAAAADLVEVRRVITRELISRIGRAETAKFEGEVNVLVIERAA